LFDAQDDIDKKRELLIADIESKLGKKEIVAELFQFAWRVM
jgi:hypothetical protein